MPPSGTKREENRRAQAPPRNSAGTGRPAAPNARRTERHGANFRFDSVTLVRNGHIDPGTRFEYCNEATYLLSAILSEVTGMTAADFAEDVLFGPLGIDEFSWDESPEGVTLGPANLYLRPTDFARLGELYVRDGVWGDERIVSTAWIDAATSSHVSPARRCSRTRSGWTVGSS